MRRRRSSRTSSRRISSINIDAGTKGTEQLTIVKDLFIGVAYHDFGGGKIGQPITDVDTLDTSSAGFTNLEPIEILPQQDRDGYARS